MAELEGSDMQRLILAAQDAAKNQIYQEALSLFERIVRWASAEFDGSLVLARAALEAADVAHYAKALDRADTWYSLAIDIFELHDGEEAKTELISALKGHAANTVSQSQQQQIDKRLFVVLCRKAYFLFDRVVVLIDPELRSVNPTLIGPLLSLGQLAANLQRFDLSILFFERNIKIRKSIGQSTETIYGHLQKVEEKVKQISSSSETQWAHQQRDAQEDLQLQEARRRSGVRIAAFKGLLAIAATEKPSFHDYVRSLQQQQQQKQQLSSPVREVRPSSAESIQRSFYTTGSFSGMTQQQELEAFRRDVDLGKAAVKNKQLEDAHDYFQAAAEKAGQGLVSVIPVEEHRSALGSLAYVFCMRAQNECEKGTYKFRRMMANSIVHYKKVIEMTEERIAEVQADEAEELSLSATYLQLGVVCVNLDRPETGLFFMRKARDVKLRLRRDATSEEKQILQVEKGVQKRDAELLASASQLAEARKQTIAVDHSVKLQDCVRWLLAAKMLMQQRKCEEAEPLLLQCVVGIEQLIKFDAMLRLKPDYRQALTALGASYYFVAQEHGKRTQAFTANSEQALVYYQQVLSLLQESPGPDDPSCCPILFNVACCYVNLRRYDIASRYFHRCREIKVRNGMPTEDLEANLEALEVKLLSQIDDDNLFASRSQRGSTGNTPTIVASGPADPTTPTGSAKELPLTMSMNQSAMSKLGRKRVSFLMPGEVDTSADGSDTDSAPSSPTRLDLEPKIESILLTGESKILTTPLNRRMSTTATADQGSKQLTASYERQASLSVREAADLNTLVQNATQYVAKEEIEDRVQLLQLFELLRRSTIMFFFHQAVNQSRISLQVSLEVSHRAALTVQSRKEWLALACQLLEEMDYVHRVKLFSDFKKAITLPSISHHDKLTSMQEAKGRTAVHSSQRLSYFFIVEQANRERVDLWERKTFQSFSLLATESTAFYTKSSMFTVASRIAISFRTKFIGDVERLTRLALVDQEQTKWDSDRRMFALSTHHVKEQERRTLIRLHEDIDFVPMDELGSRSLLVATQRTIFQSIAVPMRQGELFITERLERHDLSAYAEVSFCLFFLLPTHDVREEHHRRLLGQSWMSQLTESVAASFVEEESIARRELQRELQNKLRGHFFQTLLLLENHDRQCVTRQRETMIISQVCLPMMRELETTARQLLTEDYHRRLDAVVMLSQLRNREMISSYEARSRMVIRVLEEEGICKHVSTLEERLREAIEKRFTIEATRLHLMSKKLLIVMQESIFRQAGERLMQLHRHEKIMCIMAPLTLEKMFRQFATRKIVGAEMTLRRSATGHAFGVTMRLAMSAVAERAIITVQQTQMIERKAFRSILADHGSSLETLDRSTVAAEQSATMASLWREKQVDQRGAMTRFESRSRAVEESNEASCRDVSLTFLHQRWMVYQDQHLTRVHMALSMRRSFWTNIRKAAERSLVVVYECEERRADEDKGRIERIAVMAACAIGECQAHAADTLHEKVALAESTDRYHRVECDQDAELAELYAERSRAACRVEIEVAEREARSLRWAENLEDVSLLLSDMTYDRQVIEREACAKSELRIRTRLFRTGQLIMLRDVIEPFLRGKIEVEAKLFHQNVIKTQFQLGAVFCEEKAASIDLFLSFAFETKLAVLGPQAFDEYVAIPFAFVLGMRELAHDEEEDFAELLRDFYVEGRFVGVEIEEHAGRRELLSEECYEVASMQHTCCEEHLALFASEAMLERAAIAEQEAQELVDIEAVSTIALIERLRDSAVGEAYYDFCFGKTEIFRSEGATAIEEEQTRERLELLDDALKIQSSSLFIEAAAEVIDEAENDIREAITACEQHEFDYLTQLLKFTHNIFLLQIAERASRRRMLSNENNSAIVILSEGRAGAAFQRIKKAIADEECERAALSVEGRGGLISEFVEPTKRLLVLHEEARAAARLLVTQEEVLRQCWTNESATIVRTSTDAFCSNAWATLASSSLLLHSILSSELTERRDLVCGEQAEHRELQLMFEEHGSVILLGYRESGRRHRLETVDFQELHVQPLELIELDLIHFHQSLEFACREEASARWLIELQALEQLEATHRPALEAFLMCCRELDGEEVNGRLDILSEYEVTHSSQRHVFAAETAMRVAENIVQVSNRKVAAVHSWSALKQSETVSRNLAVEHASYFLVMVKAEEILRRSSLDEDQEQERRFLWAKEVLDDEKAGRGRLQHLLELHATFVDSCIARIDIHQSEETDLFRIRSGEIVDELMLVRLRHAIVESSLRASIEKYAVFSTFFIYQCHVIMPEFVRREEAIQRVLTVVRSERRGYELIRSEFEITMPIASAASSRPSSRSDGRTGGTRGSTGRPMPPLPSPLFAQRPRGFLLEPLNNAPKLHVDDKNSITAIISRKKVRKQLAALATADECMIREALNVRPMSASSAAPSHEGTPRSLGESRSSSSMKLAPMNSAFVRFQKTDAADVAQRIAEQQLVEGIKHLVTHERYARHALVEGSEKDRRSLVAEMLLEQFELEGELALEQTVEELATEIMGAMDSFF